MSPVGTGQGTGSCSVFGGRGSWKGISLEWGCLFPGPLDLIQQVLVCGPWCVQLRSWARGDGDRIYLRLGARSPGARWGLRLCRSQERHKAGKEKML